MNKITKAGFLAFWISLWFAATAMMAGQIAQAAEVVRVAGYDFPPFVEDAATEPHGITLQMLEALNKLQSRYEFRFVATSARRRYLDFNEGKFDLILFETPEWEWSFKKYPVDFSRIFLRGGEMFIALAEPGRGQEYFTDLKGKSIAGVSGYHYDFAGFEANPEVLQRKFGLRLVERPVSVIEAVLSKGSDLGIVTDAYLRAYVGQHPEAKSKLLLSDRYDQTYAHRILVRRDGPVSVAQIDGLLDQMEREGVLAGLWRENGLHP